MGIATVYVPLDGSEHAASALPAAAVLAERCGAELVLLSTPWPDEQLETVERYLDAQIAWADHPKMRSLLVRDRAPAPAICTMAAEDGAVVCMSTRGRGAARAALLGSVGEAVLRTTSRPVLLVGPAFRPGWALAEHPIVVAGIDDSERSLAALRDAGDLAATIGGRVRAVQVLRPTDVARRGTHDRSQLLDRVIAELREAGTRVDIDIVDAFDPADALAAQARDRQAGFISVASHGRTGIARAVLGSVAVSTVRRAPCPVLVSGPRVPRHIGDGDGDEGRVR